MRIFYGRNRVENDVPSAALGNPLLVLVSLNEQIKYYYDAGEDLYVV